MKGRVASGDWLEVSRERCEMQTRVQECADPEQAKDRVRFPNSHQSVTE